MGTSYPRWGWIRLRTNLTGITSERKTRDFYTILNGCPQN
jgi:hypothetical protein